jgi:enterochelin esterase-like enzyme
MLLYQELLMSRKIGIWLAMACLGCLEISAQELEPITIGHQMVLQSSILGENRPIQIYTPRSWSDSCQARYQVIYVFDGEALFLPVVSTVSFMHYGSEIPQAPEMIVVGIPNTDRQRDMPIPQRYGQGWGEANFMRFIRDELMPFIAERYPTSGLDIALGHSQGGLFATYLLAECPEQFRAAIALDAPVDIAGNLEDLKRKVALVTDESSTHYISVEDRYGWQDEWDLYLSSNGLAKRIHSDGETHETMPYKGIYDGLKQLFTDFAPAQKDLKLSQLQAQYDALSRSFGTSIDIPERVLLASAGRKVRENRKQEILELLEYSKQLYGRSDRWNSIYDDALTISKEPDPQVDYYLNLPPPARSDAEPFLGKWSGTVFVEGGTNMDFQLHIEWKEDHFQVSAKAIWQQDFSSPDLFTVSEGKLIWGRKNRGGGIYVSEGVINSDGDLTGTERLIGIEPPEGYSLPQNSFVFTRED